MDIQKIAQALVNELQSEQATVQNNLQKLQGAVQGVDLLYSRVIAELEKEQQDEQDNKAKDKKSKPKKSK